MFYHYKCQYSISISMSFVDVYSVRIFLFDTFFPQILEAAKHLHLKEHTVLDGSGNIVKLAAPVECKGIVGSDDRLTIFSEPPLITFSCFLM